MSQATHKPRSPRLEELAKEFLVDDFLKVGDRVILREEYELNGGIDFPAGTIGIVRSIIDKYIGVEVAKLQGRGIVRHLWDRSFWKKLWRGERRG